MAVRNTPEYRTWQNMRQRCNNPNNPGYRLYGGRGIKVCDRWASFENFYADMGRRPSSKHSIDRIDNSGNYEPGNCRWAMPEEQSYNKRSNSLVEFQGRSVPKGRLVFELGITRDMLDGRIKRGVPIERAATAPKYTRSRLRVGTSSKYIGVSWYKKNRKWGASVQYRGKNIYLGLYECEEDAARARDAKAAELYGEGVLLNFPQEVG